VPYRPEIDRGFHCPGPDVRAPKARAASELALAQLGPRERVAYPQVGVVHDHELPDAVRVVDDDLVPEVLQPPVIGRRAHYGTP